MADGKDTPAGRPSQRQRLIEGRVTQLEKRVAEMVSELVQTQQVLSNLLATYAARR